ncbi:hypothetical protein AN960_20900 [Bacillus sp. FJAT-25509]|uniref:hypothetical protein n=1 Tax=Bacillus sp. FJAT-25509 TaxID=1712029 RepID=UPI0006F48861|nr:hypothetical protein [Bacillus sp. FJAT-25509]KQL33534.1 hypothetical protein AN960_20900 [Bacillus sp. FJAT-25509]
MVISISGKLWNLSFTDDSIYKTIKKILSWVESGKHRLIFENGINTDQIIQSEKYINYSETIKSLVMEHFYSGNKNEKIVRITNTESLNLTGQKSFYDGLLLIDYVEKIEYQYIDVSKIDTYLGRLLYITVENTESDKRFIQAVYRALRGRELCTEREVQFLHGGGDTIDKVVIENSLYPTRMICIVDSDRKHPNQTQEESSKVKRLLSICEEKNLKLVVLEKREIENYIPVEALENWLSKENRQKEKDHPFFKFTLEQRAFFDMKKGLKKQDAEIQEIMDLYAGYTSEELSSGFGKTVWQAFDEIATTQYGFSDYESELNEMVCAIESLL